MVLTVTVALFLFGERLPTRMVSLDMAIIVASRALLVPPT